MQIRAKVQEVEGFYRIAKYATRYLVMLSEKANYKIKVLDFWEKQGLEATLDAYPVKRRSLFYWKHQRYCSQGPDALNEDSKRPHRLRKRRWAKEIIEEIKTLRKAHPNLSKEKIYPLLINFCEARQLTCPKARTIGHLIADDPRKMRMTPKRINRAGESVVRKKVKKLRKPKSFKPSHPGHCVALDTIERCIDGKRRYILTFIDLYSRFSFAIATSSHTSLAASRFFQMAVSVFPYAIENVLTDNVLTLKSNNF